MRVPRCLYTFLTVDFRRRRKKAPGRFFRMAETHGKIYRLTGISCLAIGSICLVFETKTAPRAAAPSCAGMEPTYLKSDRMVCGAWLAIDRACTPNCCLTCNDWRLALSSAILASTRLPMPVVSVSDSFWVKVAWIENFAAPADNLASAPLTFESEV